MTAKLSTLQLPGVDESVGARWRVVLPWLPLRMNEREGLLFKKQFFVLKKEKVRAADDIARARDVQGITPATGRRGVLVTIQKGPRGGVDDRGNRWSRTKAICDAMVKTGVLVDDADRFLDLNCIERKGPEAATIIDIWDCDLPAEVAALK